MLEDPRLKMSRDLEAEPIVEDTRGAEMSERPPRPRRISGKVLLMTEEPKPSKRGTNRMAPVPKKTGSGRQPRARPDQVEPAPQRRPKSEEPGYVRLRVRVEEGELSVQDITAVEGPLLEHTPLQGDLAYEVLVGGKRVASGSIPDIGVMRSFPHPDPARGQEGHYITPAASFDFLIRIPKDTATENNLRRMQIPLYRIKEGPLPQTEGPESLGERFEKELREVGRIKGVTIDELPKSAQAQARRALR